MCYIFIKKSLRISYQGQNLFFAFLDITGMYRNNHSPRKYTVTVDLPTKQKKGKESKMKKNKPTNQPTDQTKTSK